MSEFLVYSLQSSSVLFVYAERETIDMSPSYQRLGDIWPLEKRQLLIDSLLNGFDIPKLYLHELPEIRRINDRIVRYAVVDGKQRLQAIWAFIDGNFPLDADFRYLSDEKIKAGGLTYEELAKRYPRLKNKFDGMSLPIQVIRTSDLELIEEMFSRLNEAVPLNAAEKRNAYGGSLPPVIRDVATGHRFFKRNLPFGNQRYRHFDIVTKFLYFESKDGIADTKKRYLDDFVRSYRAQAPKPADSLGGLVEANLDVLTKKFTQHDELLGRVGWISLYYLLFRAARDLGIVEAVDRAMLASFEQARAENRAAAERGDDSDYEMLEFDQYSQSPNDAYALRLRMRALTAYLVAQFDVPVGLSQVFEEV